MKHMLVEKFKQNLISAKVENYPYPHIHLKKVFGESFDNKNIFPNLHNYDQNRLSKNNLHLGIKIDDIKENDKKSFWRPFIDFLESDEIFEIIANKFELKEKKINQDAHFGINTPVKSNSSVRGPHFDNTKVLYAGLIYMRDADDDSKGGNFRIFEKNTEEFSISEGRSVSDEQVKLYKEIKYEFSDMILFKNSPVSVHSVSNREITKHTRKYIAFNATCDENLFKIKPKTNLKSKIKNIFNFLSVDKKN